MHTLLKLPHWVASCATDWGIPVLQQKCITFGPELARAAELHTSRRLAYARYIIARDKMLFMYSAGKHLRASSASQS